MKMIPKYLFILVLFYSFNIFAACKFEFIPLKSVILILKINKFWNKYGKNMIISSFRIQLRKFVKIKNS